MAKIIPFKAVRPTRDKVSLVASRSYQSYSQEELDARLKYNPFSFLHILNPDYKYHKNITRKKRHDLVRKRYLEFKEDAIFVQDETPSYYIYKIINREGLTFSGIVAAASCEDYEKDVLKKHENTIEYREQIFKNYLKTVGFNAEPVLLMYPDNDIISSIIANAQKERAEFEFTTHYRDTHYLWLIQNAEIIEKIKKEFEKISTIYIADGHHRSASSCLLSKQIKKENNNRIDNEPYNHFLSYLIPESHLKIFEFNRIIKDLNGLTKETFLLKLDTMFRIENRGIELYKPSKKHHFSMYLDGEYYSLYLRRNNYTFNTPLDALDTHILHETILKPILGISDVRNNTRIEYSHGNNDLVTIKSKIDNGMFKVGFGLVAISVEEMKAIADDNLTMPPKSTFIEPKLRSGVIIYEF